MNDISSLPERIYVVGGAQKKTAHQVEEWHRHRQGLIVEVDTRDGSHRKCLEYVSPPEACAEEDPAVLFKAATLVDDTFYVCTQTEVLLYNFPTFEQIGYISLSCFNDVHHVRPSGRGTLIVVTTGLDLLVEIDKNGTILNEWNVLGEEPWARFSKETDYRKVVTTKPHHAHPNYCFYIGEELWATRFEQRDAISLQDPSRRIDIGVEKPHDGIVFQDKVYFTTVDGHIIVADTKSLEVETVLNLNEIHSEGLALGWCRGLLVLNEEKVLVGFSRLRPTKIRENLRWMKHKLGLRETAGNMSSRVALYDLRTKSLCWEQNVEGFGLNVVFSIHS